MESFNLQANNWKDVRNQKYKIAVLPWGCTEAHNLHLPYGTDTFLAEKVAYESCKKAWERGAGCVLLPAIPFGVNSGQMEVRLCMNMNPTTQKMIIKDVIQVLVKDGINKLIILNAHGGNNFQPMIRELSVEMPQIMICTVSWWKACNGDDYFTEQGDHAGELETASMQAIMPELVLPLDQAGDGAETKMKIKGFREKWAWMPRRWIYVTEDTGVGNPKDATPEKGRIFMDACIEKIADFIVEFSKIDKEKELYE